LFTFFPQESNATMKIAALAFALVVQLSMYECLGRVFPTNHIRAIPLNPQPLPPGIVAYTDAPSIKHYRR
jgi:hypothetical protein